MWMEQLQNGISLFVASILGAVVMVVAKVYLEKVILMRKFLEFLSHFIPAVLFLTASSSKEVCAITGNLVGVTEKTGFFVLVMFSFMTSFNTIMFLWEVSRDSVVPQSQANETTKEKTN